MDKFDLDRFVSAQNEDFKKAKAELETKKKKSCWMWYMFPQLQGLGTSVRSYFYGIESLEEAKEYYKNAKLRKNLDSLTDIVLSYDNNTSLIDVFGYTDVWKFHSCMTLFYLATKEKRFKRAIFKYFDGVLDEHTIQLLQNVI